MEVLTVRSIGKKTPKNARMDWHGGVVGEAALLVIMNIHWKLSRVLELNLQSEMQTHGLECCKRGKQPG